MHLLFEQVAKGCGSPSKLPIEVFLQVGGFGLFDGVGAHDGVCVVGHDH
jgi:hypothetical protein